jgi:DNA-directed RNA polymerase subunit RPC12/RpoP
MRSISVQIRTSCSKCGGGLPLNAMVPRLACAACSAQNELGDEFWITLLGDEDLGSATVLMHGREISLDVGIVKGPVCAECGTAIPAADAMASVDAGSIACGKCGARTLLRVPPRGWVLSGFPLLVGEDELQLAAGGAALDPATAAARPVAFNCPTCGGVLQVDGSARVVQCGYCSGSAFLPDALWHVFHPVPVTRPWYLLQEPGVRRRARKEAEDADAAPERLDELSHHMDAEVREAVARNPRTPGETLLRLVAADDSLASAVLENPSLPDASWEVLTGLGQGWILAGVARSDRAPPEVLRTVADRIAHRLSDDYAGDEDAFDDSEIGDALQALAENPRTPAEVLAQAARLNGERTNSDRVDMDEALAKHPNAPPALLAELARSEDDSAREAVAANPATPVEVLEALASDPEWDVRTAVAGRRELSPATLKRLASDQDDSVQLAARTNPSFPRFNLWKTLFGR